MYDTLRKERRREVDRERRRRGKVEILSHYSGGSTECAYCGFGDIRALSIDHMNGGG